MYNRPQLLCMYVSDMYKMFLKYCVLSIKFMRRKSRTSKDILNTPWNCYCLHSRNRKLWCFVKPVFSYRNGYLWCSNLIIQNYLLSQNYFISFFVLLSGSSCNWNVIFFLLKFQPLNKFHSCYVQRNRRFSSVSKVTII